MWLCNRLNKMDSYSSSTSTANGFGGFNIEGIKRTIYGAYNPSMLATMGPQGLKTFGKSLKSGVTRAIFPEDLKVSDKKIFDPQDRSLILWNKLFVISCIIAVSIHHFFFYLPIVEHRKDCLGMDFSLAATTTTLRTMVDAFYIIHVIFQFRTAYIAPSSRVFGRGELVIDTKEIAKRYLFRYFIVDVLAVLPLPQVRCFLFFYF